MKSEVLNICSVKMYDGSEQEKIRSVSILIKFPEFKILIKES